MTEEEPGDDLLLKPAPSILIIDDDPMARRLLSDILKRMGHETASASTLQEGLLAAQANDFDLILLDVGLPDGSGLEALQSFTAAASSPEVIIITGAGDPSGAELAIRSGAWSYIEKPPSKEQISLSIARALQYRESRRMHTQDVMALRLDGFIGKTPLMRSVFDLIARAATTDVNILITGETGSGKELVAQAIHQNSSRASRPFVVLDCSALPETLVESLLFGHAKGAFTGADRSKEGIVKQADLGTLFLDEIGELPFHVQKSFLRVLQERRFRPVGSKAEVQSDFRLLAATNKDLEAMVQSGAFREDLLFRLNTFVIRIPPLRERRQDIKELVAFQIGRLCEKHGIGSRGLSPDFIEALEAYEWPGNVRQLFHVLERSMAVAGAERILFSKHLPDEIRVFSAKASLGKRAPAAKEETTPGGEQEDYPKFKSFRQDMERRYLQELMASSQGSIKEACRKSGLSQSRLYELLKVYGITT